MQRVVGIDEVGRGCWAGPLLVVAARQKTALPEGLADSKQLTKTQRENLYASIQASCELGEGWVSAEEIDLLGLTGAMQLAVERALTQLDAQNDDVIIMDGHINYCAPTFTNVQTVIKADALHPIVSAASIYAKVSRDVHMADLAEEFPQNGFEQHVGYGTALHRERLQKHGVSVHHRKSYKPIRVYYESCSEPPSRDANRRQTLQNTQRSLNAKQNAAPNEISRRSTTG